MWVFPVAGLSNTVAVRMSWWAAPVKSSCTTPEVCLRPRMKPASRFPSSML